MKYFTFFLGIYFLAITFWPCKDTHFEGNTTHTTHVEQSTASKGHPAEDLCSPFCCCNCCNTAQLSLTFAKIKSFKIPFFEKKKVFIEPTHLDSNYWGNIWQPPKINA